MEVDPINPIARASTVPVPAPASRFVLDFDLDESIVIAIALGGPVE